MRVLSAWILMILVAFSSGPAQAFVHVCSQDGAHWGEGSCDSHRPKSKKSCCSKVPDAVVENNNCCQSVFLFGISAKFKEPVMAAQFEFGSIELKPEPLSLTIDQRPGFSDSHIPPKHLPKRWLEILNIRQ
jgi:hypothetical protein